MGLSRRRELRAIYFVPSAAMWAAAFGRYFVGGLDAMSNYLQSKSLFDALPFLNGDSTFPFAGETAAERAAAERSVDYSLRNVPLPDGLLTRLGKFIGSLPDEASDHVDWLGC
jgi:hypothetical protein